MPASDPTLAAQRMVLVLVAASALVGTVRHPDPPPLELDGVTLCAALDRGVMRAGACDGEAATTARARRALGDPPCWDTASVERMTDLRGVGERTARTLVAFRNAGGRPDVDALAALPGIGAATAAAIADGVSTRCQALPAAD